MSLENVIAFWRKVQSDASLQAKARAEASDAGRLVEIAAEAGCACTAAELMAADSVLRFWTEVAKDTGLQTQLQAAKNLDPSAAAQEVMRVASARGFSFTAEQMSVVTPAVMAAGSGDLDDASLSSVTGGAGLQAQDVSTSLKSALKGGFDTKLKIGTGLVPTLRV